MYNIFPNPETISPESHLLLTKKLFIIGNSLQELSNQLSQFGYASITLEDTEKALELLKNDFFLNEKPADGIICDYHLLKSEAFQFIDELRKVEGFKAVPFLVATSNPRDINKVEALKKGIDDFFVYDSFSENIHKRLSFYAAYKKDRIKPKKLAENPFEFKMSFRKRLFDLVITSFILLCLSPVFLIITLLIKLDSKGPVFYISKRAGSGYKIFNFFKFRSMKINADQELKNLMEYNQYVNNPDSESSKSTFVKFHNDPRITRIGRFLRKTSLDELPQLINVLKGDMSIVGNRPLPLYEAEQLTTDLWAKRFLAPAGITGLWQVTKRGKKEMSEEERKQLDITYANNRNGWYDLKIIAKTIPALFQEESV